ncbi:MAG: aldolase/citrate lyase family protein [Pseudomonadota bacterium]
MKSFDPAIMEVLAQCGPDFLVVDQQHRPLSPTALESVILAARLYTIPVLVRIENHERATINTALDQGGLGVVAPAVGSAQEAASIVRSSLYKKGERGFSPSTAANGYGALPTDEYKELADAANIVIVQIETVSGLAAAQEIASTPNLDGVFIGPVDLAHALEKAPDEARNLPEAIDAILAAGENASTPVGIFAAAPAQLAEYRDTSMQYFVVGTDHSMVRQQGEAVLADVRNTLSSSKITLEGQQK